MSIGLLGVVAGFVLVSVLLLSLNVASRWQWWIKASAVIVTTLFFGVAYASIQAMLGWPTVQRMPTRYVLHWAHVVEPSGPANDKGAIYLWLGTAGPIDANDALAPPRAYRLPYSRELHDRVSAAQQRIREGHPQEGQVIGPAHDVDGTGMSADAPRVEFHDLPPPKPPRKDHDA